MMKVRDVQLTGMVVLFGFCLGLALFSRAGSLQAAEVKFPPTPAATPGKSRVLVTQPDCQAIVAHRASPDVAYQPGRDATGRTVVPADLSPAPAALSDGVVIDLILPFATVVPAAPGLARSETGIGRIRIDPLDGRVWLDGQLLDDPATGELAKACAQAFSAIP